MYFSIFYLLSFSLLISFYLIVSFKKIIIDPKNVLENCLYEKCSPLKVDSQINHLDFEVKIYKKHINIDVFGLKNEDLFSKSLDQIHKVIKKKTGRRKINISIIGSHKEQVFTKTY